MKLSTILVAIISVLTTSSCIHYVKADSSIILPTTDLPKKSDEVIKLDLYTPTTSSFIGPQSFSVNATITLAEPKNACRSLDPTLEFSNRIVIVRGQLCSFETQLRNVQRTGAVAMVWVSDRTTFWGCWGTNQEVVGTFYQAKDGSPKDDLNIPLVEINPNDIQDAIELLENDDNDEVKIRMFLEPSHNPYVDLHNGLLWKFFFKVMFPIVAALNVVLAGYRLITFFIFLDKKRRRELWMPQVVLLLEMFANLERLIYLSIDPVFSVGRLTYAGQMMMITIHQPLCLITTVMIAIFWSSLRKENSLSKISAFERHQKLILFIIVNLFVVDILLSILRALYISIGAIGSISGIIYSLTVLMISLSLIYLSSSALSQSRVRLNIARTFQHKSTKRVTFMFLASGICLMLSSIGWLIVSLPQLWTPTGWFTAWMLNWMSFVFTSFFQILVIQPRNKNSNITGRANNMSRMSSVECTTSQRISIMNISLPDKINISQCMEKTYTKQDMDQDIEMSSQSLSADNADSCEGNNIRSSMQEIKEDNSENFGTEQSGMSK